ncbi:hypothetical protein M407DRAFT_43120, partial [Tulasnella calospora MUT 4182]
RNLILCFDGTAKYFNDGNTNVIRLFQGLDKMKTDNQLCYYQPGIGHNFFPLSLALLLFTYLLSPEGDKICLFGFSRGAYTARCLAGMLH